MRKKKRDRDGLYRRPASTFWYASYTDAAGNRCRRSTGTDNRHEAETILGAWKQQASKERSAHKNPRSLHSLMLSYIESHGHKRSLERDGYSIKHLYRLLGEWLDIQLLTAADIHQYILTRQAEAAAPATINREMGLLSTALNWAIHTLGWSIENPAARRQCKEPPGRDRWLTQDEATRLIAAANRQPRSKHLVDFIILALHTGMRSGEILGLEWRRVDLQQNRILLGADDQKNAKPGMVPLNEPAKAALSTRLWFRAEHCPGSPWVFCNRGGHRIASIKKSFSSAVRNSGIAPCTPHDLRRTCGSWLVQAGVPIQQVSKLLRHSNISITDRIYAHLQPEQLHEAVAKLADRHDFHDNRVVKLNSGGR